MIKLRDARLVDLLPAPVAAKEWVPPLSLVFGNLTERILDFSDNSMCCSDIEHATESVLDALAVMFKIEWYDAEASLEDKRRYIKTALAIQRLAGTAYAVKKQIDTIYPGSRIEEWFEYGGVPGRYRVIINLGSEPVKAITVEEMDELLGYAKRCSAHLEEISFAVRAGIAIGAQWRQLWPDIAWCGEHVCGELWEEAMVGYTDQYGIAAGGKVIGCLADVEYTGTLPEEAVVGYSDAFGNVSLHVKVTLPDVQTEQAGEDQLTGTLPEDAMKGYSTQHGMKMNLTTSAQLADSEQAATENAAGTLPVDALAGLCAKQGVTLDLSLSTAEADCAETAEDTFGAEEVAGVVRVNLYQVEAAEAGDDLECGGED